jgi:hypothetical protein
MNPTPLVDVSIFNEVDGYVTGLANEHSRICDSYENYYAYEYGSVNSTFSTTFTVTITCIDICECGYSGLDPEIFPHLGWVRCAVVLYGYPYVLAELGIPTAVGVYTYHVVCNSSDRTASITPIY